MSKRLKKAIFKKYLNDDERIIKVTHNHFISISKEIAMDLVVWFFAPAFLIYNDIFTPYTYYVYIISFSVLAYHLYDWYADAFVITNNEGSLGDNVVAGRDHSFNATVYQRDTSLTPPECDVATGYVCYVR